MRLVASSFFFFFNAAPTTGIYTLSLHDALPICHQPFAQFLTDFGVHRPEGLVEQRSEEHTSELQSPDHLVCRLLLEKKNRTLDAGSAGRFEFCTHILLTNSKVRTRGCLFLITSH